MAYPDEVFEDAGTHVLHIGAAFAEVRVLYALEDPPVLLENVSKGQQRAAPSRNGLFQPTNKALVLQDL